MHVIEVCKHGRVISRCRCMGPHAEVRVACLSDCPVADYEPRHGRPDDDGGRPVADGRPGWRYSDRRERLPDNWDELKDLALERNPERICHWCREPGGHDLDHKRRGDDHRLENLDWIHGRRDFEAGRSRVNCHGQKTGAEGSAARPRLHRPKPVHPAFR